MNDNAYQETLFADPLGLQLRHAREKAGLKMSDVSTQLKLPVQVVDALEREDWNALGAAVYVRSYLNSYLKFLGLPAQLASDVRLPTNQAQPAVKSLSAEPVRRSMDSTWMKFASLGLTVAIVALLVMLAMHFQKPRDANEVTPLDIQSADLPAQPDVKPATSSETLPSNDNVAQAPVMAGITPIGTGVSTVTTPGSGWELTMKGDSWIEIIGVDGKRLDSGLISAGGQKQYALNDVTGMKIGNASAVEIRRNGQNVDITSFNIDNVARFLVNQDGSLSKK
jgi:cytoskeleton protein RodZ